MSDQDKRRRKVGVVLSNKMQKTIIVRTERLTRHPIYRKVVKRYKKFKVHDEEKKAQPGDWVMIAETRPISKDKRWRLLEILKKGKMEIVEKVRPSSKKSEQAVTAEASQGQVSA